MILKNKTIITLIAPNVLAGAERVVISGQQALLEDRESEAYNLKLIVIKEARFPERSLQFIQEIKRIDPKRRIQVIEIETKKAFDLAFFFSIKRALCGYNEKILIHTHGYKALIYSYCATFFAWFSRPPIIHTHHGNTGHTKMVRCYEALAMFCMKRIKKVIAVSDVMENELKKKYGLKNVELVLNMLSFNNLSELRKKKICYHQESKSDLLKLVFVGRLSPEKGPYELLEFFSMYPNKNRFHLTFIGDGIERKKMEELIKENQIANVSLTGFLNPVTSELITHQILVMPSFTEGLPMTLIESTSLGLPVIATDVGAIHSIVTHEDNGIILQDNTAASWHIALEKMLTDFENYSKRAIDKSFLIEEKYSKKNWGQKTLALYKKFSP